MFICFWNILCRCIFPEEEKGEFLNEVKLTMGYKNRTQILFHSLGRISQTKRFSYKLM